MNKSLLTFIFSLLAASAQATEIPVQWVQPQSSVQVVIGQMPVTGVYSGLTTDQKATSETYPGFEAIHKALTTESVYAPVEADPISPGGNGVTEFFEWPGEAQSIDAKGIEELLKGGKLPEMLLGGGNDGQSIIFSGGNDGISILLKGGNDGQALALKPGVQPFNFGGTNTFKVPVKLDVSTIKYVGETDHAVKLQVNESPVEIEFQVSDLEAQPALIKAIGRSFETGSFTTIE